MVVNNSEQNNFKEKKKPSYITNFEFEYSFYNEPKQKINTNKNIILIRKKPIIVETLSDTE